MSGYRDSQIKGKFALKHPAIGLSAIIGITLLSAAVCQARQPEAPPDVTVSLHSTIVATPGAVERAKHIAKSMFASIGINLVWCGEMSGHEQGVLIHAVLESGSNGEGEALGETSPFAVNHDIAIRYDRVRSSAGASQELEPLILAHVMVHEITHILQCLNRHSETGVMKAHWTVDDYCDMRWRPLEFTPEDIELIRLGMQALRSDMRR